MKRQIKFRVWCKEIKQMASVFALYFSDNGEPCHIWCRGKSVNEMYEIDDVILMQFTGLYDKDGKEIFEGDLLDFDEKEWGSKFGPEAIWLSEMIGNWGYSGGLNDIRTFRRVIGNVFENPNLLEVKS